MKNIFKPIIALMSGVAIILSGCSDFLDAEDKSNLQSDVYFLTEDGFENLSTTPYYKLRAIYGGDPVMFCSGTDMYQSGRSGYSDVTLSTYKDLTPSNTNVMNFYSACYDGIQQCNTVLYYGEKGAAGSNVSLRMDEATYLKAFYYYLLTQQFGAVPISDAYIQSVMTSFPRIPQEQVYQYIIDMLKAVETNNLLPFDVQTGRASMRAVYNLMAKVYLAWGWDFGTTASANGTNVQITDRTNFENAASYADKAINGMSPSMTFSNMWDLANDNNNDILFAIQYTRDISGQDDITTGNRQQAQFGNYYNDNCKYTSSQYPVGAKVIYLFEPGDERYAGTFMVTQYETYMNYYTATITDDTEVYGYYPAWYEDLSTLTSYNASTIGREGAKVFSSSDPSVFINAVWNSRQQKWVYSQGVQPYQTSRTSNAQSFVIRKFDDYKAVRNTTNPVSFHNIVLAHLTETYLLAAEAYYMAGNTPTSLSRLNVVRQRAGAATIGSFSTYKRYYSDGTAKSYNSGSGIDNVPYETGLDPVDVILDERARELCGEYYRWMDLRRTKRLITYNVEWNDGVTSADMMMGADGAYRWFRPFPQGEINLNDAITDADQNPGYTSN